MPLKFELKNSGLCVYQLLAGEDLAVPDGENGIFQAAAGMANYMYFVCHEKSKTCMGVDLCWDVTAAYQIAEKLGLELKGSIYTHRHFDHTGGKLPRSMTGGKQVAIEGVADVLERGGVAYVGAEDEAAVRKSQTNSEGMVVLSDGDAVPMGGEGTEELIHVWNTPGHTPGSICVLLGAQTGEELAGWYLMFGVCYCLIHSCSLAASGSTRDRRYYVYWECGSH